MSTAATTAATARPPAKRDLAGPAWIVALGVAVLFPLMAGTQYHISVGITALTFVCLAVAFDLVVGRIGALSLAQPLFFGFGAYFAALLSSRHDWSFWPEALLAAVAAAGLAIAIGIPAFRLSLHSFAIGTLGFALIGGIIAQNWVGLTGGPLCVTGVQALRLPTPFGTFTATTLTQQYFVILAIAATTVAVVFLIVRRGLGLAYTAVRDDPVLASARGLWPTSFRLGAFGLSAGFSALGGAFTAHFQGVVCPTEVNLAYTTALLIMVFIGGRASLRGVVTAAILFTAVPELLRMAEEWRLVIYGAVLLVVVVAVPDGLERLFAGSGRLWSRERRRLAGAREADS